MGAADAPFLRRRPANHVPLSPLSLLARARDVHPERLAVRYGARSYTYDALHDRSRRLAGWLQRLGVELRERVRAAAARS